MNRPPLIRRPHILVILSSTRQGRQGDKVARWLMNRLRTRSDVTFELADLRDLTLPFYDAATPPAYGEIAAKAGVWGSIVTNADGFVFVTPEYNHGYPAPLKNALDHLFREWAHKPAAIVSYGGLGGGLRGAEQLRQVLVGLQMVPVREQIGIPSVWAAFDEKGEPLNDTVDAQVDAMATDLLWWATALIRARAGDKEAEPAAIGA